MGGCSDFVDQHAESGEPVEATESAAAEWTELHNSIGNSTLFTKGDNYFIGGNIAGKPREVPLFLGGFQLYAEHCDKAAHTPGLFVRGTRTAGELQES